MGSSPGALQYPHLGKELFYVFIVVNKGWLWQAHAHAYTHAYTRTRTRTGHPLWIPIAWAPSPVSPRWGAARQGSQHRLLSLQISQLNALITLLIGSLSAGDRMKIMTICTIDVHARDVVAKMIIAKAGAPLSLRDWEPGLGLATHSRTPASTCPQGGD